MRTSDNDGFSFSGDILVMLMGLSERMSSIDDDALASLGVDDKRSFLTGLLVGCSLKAGMTPQQAHDFVKDPTIQAMLDGVEA